MAKSGIRIGALALAGCFALGCGTSEPPAGAAPRSADPGSRADPVAPPALASPRLSRLWQETRADAAPALARFWEERRGKGPLVESAANDAESALVTFLWRGAPGSRYVGILNGPSGSQGEKQLDLLPGTDVWFLTARLPRDARLTYRFLTSPSGPPYRMTIGQMEERFRTGHPDPLNPTVAFGLSFFDLPGAPPQPFARRATGVPEGSRVEATIKSALLHEDRRVLVYTPPGYDPQRPEPYGVVFVFDGEWYGHWTEAIIQAPTTLDNLIAQKHIPAVLAVLVDNQGTRERDLAQSEPFADFLADELVPWLRRGYHVGPAPEHAVVAGSSLGGLQALFTAIRRPEAFGNVLSQSGAFHVGPGGWRPEVIAEESSTWLAEKVASLPRRPVRVWMEAGDFEAATILGSNRHVRDVLRAKGYSVSYREYHGGHDYACWRDSLADGLIALLAPSEPGAAR
jgi:enterochelin esterase family protein